MKVLEAVEVKLEWHDLENLTFHRRRDTQVRVAGVHVGQVLRHIAIASKMYSEEDREDEMPLRMFLGLAFEEMAARLYKDMIWQPGEFEADGVSGNPDGVTLIEVEGSGAVCVDEFKYTGKSQRIKGAKPKPDGSFLSKDLKDIRTEWLWMQQVMAYINLLRRSDDDEYADMCLGRFHICWKFGTYTFPMQEKYVRYLVRFDEDDLAMNWDMVQGHKGEVEVR